MPTFTAASLSVCVLLFFIPNSANGQASLLEYQTCQAGNTPPDARIFACSRVIGDTVQPANTRAEALRNRAAAYNLLKDFTHALADLNESLRLNPADSKTYLHRGGVYSNLKDYAHALPDYTTAI